MQEINIEVSGLEKKEYVQAGSESVLRLLPVALGVVTLLTLVIAMVIDDYSLRSLLPPYGLTLLALLLWRGMIAASWKGFPADTAFSYHIDEKGWTLCLGEERVQIPWERTARLTVRSRVVLLYNDTNRSNLLPRRCLGEAELQQLRQWYAASRAEYRSGARAREAQERTDYRIRRAEERYRRKQRRKGK